MADDMAIKVAKSILDDRRGANYYQDPDILSEYLSGSLGFAKDIADQIAEVIIDDRDGADYYANVGILAEFLESKIPELH